MKQRGQDRYGPAGTGRSLKHLITILLTNIMTLLAK
jgi:hypothetical protein